MDTGSPGRTSTEVGQKIPLPSPIALSGPGVPSFPYIPDGRSCFERVPRTLSPIFPPASSIPPALCLFPIIAQSHDSVFVLPIFQAIHPFLDLQQTSHLPLCPHSWTVSPRPHMTAGPTVLDVGIRAFQRSHAKWTANQRRPDSSNAKPKLDAVHPMLGFPGPFSHERAQGKVDES